MTEFDAAKLRQASDDLRAIRAAVEERRDQRMPRSIALVWAMYALICYPLLDVNPRVGGWALLICGVLGGVLTAIFGARHDRRVGERDRTEARRCWLHFLGILLGVGAVVVLAATQRRAMSGRAVGQVIVVVVGLVYYLWGVHGDRNFLWLGPLMMAGAIAVGFIPRYPWTALGVVIALGLAVPAFIRREPVSSNEQP